MLSLYIQPVMRHGDKIDVTEPFVEFRQLFDWILIYQEENEMVATSFLHELDTWCHKKGMVVRSPIR